MRLESSGFTFKGHLDWPAITAGSSRLRPNLAAMSALGMLAMAGSSGGRMLRWGIALSSANGSFQIFKVGDRLESSGHQHRAVKAATALRI
jgi:hypothetical protein